MKYKIHVAAPIKLIHKPFMVRVNHGTNDHNSMELIEFRKILRKVQNTCTGTWGYTQILREYDVNKDAHKPSIYSWVPDTITFSRSYWAFSDDADVLQFILTVGQSAKRVYMWPKGLRFTITKYED